MSNEAVIGSILASVLTLMIGYLIKVTTDVRTDVRLVNGRLGKLEERVTGDMKIGDERQHNMDQRVERLER